MNRDTVIALAREAGLYPHVEWGGMFYVTSGFLENFAALVAAAERESCAKVVENYALGYAEPVWASKLTSAIRARSET